MIKRNAGQGSRFKTAFVRHFFNFDIWEQTAFKKAGRIQSQIDRIRPAFRLTQGIKETFFPDSFKLRHIYCQIIWLRLQRSCLMMPRTTKMMPPKANPQMMLFYLRFQGWLFQNRCYRLLEHRFHNRLK